MRNEVRALMMQLGLPSFYVTINPADVFNPLVKFLAGSEIDIVTYFPNRYQITMNSLFWLPAILRSDVRHAKPENTNQGLHAGLRAFLDRMPNTVVVTIPTALNLDIVERDLSPYFSRGNRETVFYFIGDIPYSLAMQRHLFDHITERNAIVREVARASGVRLLDLQAEFDTERAADFRENFFDVVHLRPGSYRHAARAVYEGIRDLL